jgi:hypothetical protein
MSTWTRTAARHVWLWGPAAVAFVVGVLGIGVSSIYGGQAAVDEPQYLMTALSLAEDGDLDVSDELSAQRWRVFHSDQLPVQTQPFPGGSEISPHDPLLPLLVAAPMGLFGWVGVKVALCALAGACAALLAWTAARRFGVSQRVAGVGSAVAFASPPLAVYSQQVYPEMPAAVVTLAAVALLTARAPRSRLARTANHGAVVGAVIVLPWLGSKYVPVAVALTGVLLVRLVRDRGARAATAAVAVLGLAGAVYLAVHRAVWGGWTVYASGDHFQQTGEFSVVGVAPSYLGRSLRTVGLFVDQHYGLVPWQPAWLLLVPAVVAMLVRRPSGWVTLLVPLCAAWATAVWVALTMHGFWWPGRQVVVVLPLAAIGILWLVDRVAPRLRVWALGLGVPGVLSMAFLLVQGWQGPVTWVEHFEKSYAPTYRALGPLLPDYSGDSFMVGHVLWLCALTGLAVATWRVLRRPAYDVGRPEPAEPQPVPQRRKVMS